MKRFLVKLALPRGPEHYWKVARIYGAAGFTARDLAGCTNGVAFETVRRWILDMVKLGAIKQIGARKAHNLPVPTNVYAVAIRALKPPTARRPSYEGRRGRAQQQMWTAMRTLGAFTVRELAVAASTDVIVVGEESAKKYVRQLALAGVLVNVEPVARGASSAHGSAPATWRLKKSADSGPSAPKVFDAKIVFDVNRQQIVGESEVLHG